MSEKQIILICILAVIFLVFLVFVNLLDNKSLNGIKRKTVGQGQHGTARWATKSEIKKTFVSLPFEPEKWRKGEDLPAVQGTIIGCRGHRKTVALVDTGDVHTLMIGAAGTGKTSFFLYPNLELACASGMSFLQTDTKGDVARNYGTIAKKYYGYNVSVLDLRNPTRSDENNILHLVNKYMDIYLSDKTNLSAKAKAEKYAKITAKTIINIGGGASESSGVNAYFYDAAEGLLASVILLLAEFGEKNERHIVSVFKLIQDLLAKYQPSPKAKPKMYFSKLMEKLPPEHKAKWLAGAAMNTSEQTMLSVMSTALSRLNGFLDSEMEQLLCFETAVDAELFCTEKSAIFVILPEEDMSKYFMVSLLIQQLYREILVILKLKMQLDNTSGKKVYGYLKPEIKRNVDEIFKRISQHYDIAKLYEKWCELERQKYKAYTQKEKEFPALWENKVFQPIRNMIIKAVIDMNNPAADIKVDLHDFTEQSTQHSESERSANDINNVLYSAEQSNEYDEIQLEKMERHQSEMLTTTIIGLIANLSRIIADDYNQKFNSARMSVDKKLRRMIHEKNQALGIKEEHGQTQEY